MKPGIPAERCCDPAAALGTALELGGWRGDEDWDLMLHVSFQVSM